MRRRDFVRAAIAVAGIKVGIGLVGWALGDPVADTTSSRYAIYFAHVIAFSTMAIALARGGRADVRARLFGVCCLLVASLFADRLVLRLGERWTDLEAPAFLLAHIQVEAFLPYMFWAFAAELPRPAQFGWPRRISVTALRVTAVVGILLFAINLVYVIGQAGGEVGSWVAVPAAFSRFEEFTLYHPVMFLLMIPALPYLVWKAHMAPAEGRRRVWLLLTGIVVGSAPVLTIVLVMTASPSARSALMAPSLFRWVEVIVYAGTLSIPFTTGYAILMHRALDVRLVVRKAVRYAFARYTLLTATAAPFIALVVLLFRHRTSPLSELLTGSTGLLLGAVSTIGLLGLIARRRILRGIDRRFFRDHYDAHQILHDLVHGTRSVNTVAEFEALLLREIDRAFHLDSAVLLVRGADEGVMVSPSGKIRPLRRGAPLAALLDEKAKPLDVDLSRPDPAVAQLPFEDREWLADGGFQLLVPLLAPSGSLSGLLALGDKRSELPFGHEDRMLLATVASAAAAAFEERFHVSEEVSPTDGVENTAVECPRCGLLSPERTSSCPTCASPMEPATVPHVLRGKFRFEMRLGTGGMGIVYRATDLDLGRSVAIKTLPWVAPAFATRLRREARVMAAVSHPNLAVIYGVEFFHGTPMLVVEYLSQGTLTDRLRDGPLPWPQAVDLGLTLAHVADHIHRAGILHRDIKPSNVGFTKDGTAKLLDFGLARAMAVGQGSDHHISLSSSRITLQPSQDASAGDSTPDETFAGALVGTAAYLSPEAVAGQPPDPSFDLWGICLVVYEAIAGTNPLSGQNIAQTLYRISTTALPDPREIVPDCPAPVATYLAKTLHADRAQRPENGRALAAGFRSLLIMAGTESVGPSNRRSSSFRPHGL